MLNWKKEGAKLWREKFQYYIKEKKNVVGARPVMLFVLKKLFLW